MLYAFFLQKFWHGTVGVVNGKCFHWRGHLGWHQFSSTLSRVSWCIGTILAECFVCLIGQLLEDSPHKLYLSMRAKEKNGLGVNRSFKVADSHMRMAWRCGKLHRVLLKPDLIEIDIFRFLPRKVFMSQKGRYVDFYAVDVDALRCILSAIQYRLLQVYAKDKHAEHVSFTSTSVQLLPTLSIKFLIPSITNHIHYYASLG